MCQKKIFGNGRKILVVKLSQMFKGLFFFFKSEGEFRTTKGIKVEVAFIRAIVLLGENKVKRRSERDNESDALSPLFWLEKNESEKMKLLIQTKNRLN